MSQGDIAAVRVLYNLWSFAGNTAGVGNRAEGQMNWKGDFNADGRDDVLSYFPADRSWWLGTYAGNQLSWIIVGTTPGFGSLLEGQIFWTGRFSRFDRTEILFYSPGDRNWWLGTLGGGVLNWTNAGNTAGFGSLLEGQKFWIGDFNADGYDDVLFYFPADQNWWLGTYAGGHLNWSFVGNTAGFGNLLEGQMFWAGRFSRFDRTEILFYFPVDRNWWLGTLAGGQLNWTNAGNTAGFGSLLEGQIFWTGDFNGDNRDDVLFFFPVDQNWWIASHDGSKLKWSPAGDTTGFGSLLEGQKFWIGDFNGNGSADILFYAPTDQRWWMGSHHGGNKLEWSYQGNTSGFGDLQDGQIFWSGRFSRADRVQILFYYPGDRNWWLGSK